MTNPPEVLGEEEFLAEALAEEEKVPGVQDPVGLTKLPEALDEGLRAQGALGGPVGSTKVLEALGESLRALEVPGGLTKPPEALYEGERVLEAPGGTVGLIKVL